MRIVKNCVNHCSWAWQNSFDSLVSINQFFKRTKNHSTRKRALIKNNGLSVSKVTPEVKTYHVSTNNENYILTEIIFPFHCIQHLFDYIFKFIHNCWLKLKKKRFYLLKILIRFGENQFPFQLQEQITFYSKKITENAFPLLKRN